MPPITASPVANIPNIDRSGLIVAGIVLAIIGIFMAGAFIKDIAFKRKVSDANSVSDSLQLDEEKISNDDGGLRSVDTSNAPSEATYPQMRNKENKFEEVNFS